ncbi:transmembrane and TPR repeat-containing protein 4-like, partial [Diaphorina citri]|uniref:dolichyl-phosphate-mannose--protein mannosyltransferase n=2 Tax=Diaphorina citri TaxID=121845 RepID=A0A1S3DS71_DIACI
MKHCQANSFDSYLRSHESFIKIFLFIVGVSVFWNSVWGDFVFDDAEAIVNNDDVQGTAPLWKLFYNDYWGSLINQNYSHKSYRPLTVITFRWNCLLFGKAAFSFHVVNIILHGLCSSLTYSVVQVLSRGHSPSTAFYTALLFTVHPIHCESVAGIVGRADLLAAFLGFVSILVYKYCSSTHNVLKMISLTITSALLCVGAMLCKEQGITVLGILSIYDLFVVHKLTIVGCYSLHIIKPHRQRFLLIRQGLLAIVGLLALYVRWSIMGSAPPTFKPIDNPASFHEQFVMRVFNYNYIYAINLWLLLCPQWLCNDWSMGSLPLIQSWTDYRLVFVLAFWTAMAGLLLRCVQSLFDQQRRRDVLIATSLIIVPFLPASNLLFRVGFVIAERNLYIPSLGFCLLVAVSLNKAVQQFDKHKQNIIAAFIFVMFILSVRTLDRNEDWNNEVRLYESAIRVSPLNAKMHFNLGRQAAEQNNQALAVTYYREAIRLNPTYAQAMNNLANLLRLDQPHEAEILFKKAVQYEGSRAIDTRFLRQLLRRIKVIIPDKKENQAMIRYQLQTMKANTWSHESFIKIFLFIVGVSVFWNSVWGDFVFDDAEAIVNNDDVQGTAPLWKLFYNDYWGSLINQNYSHKSYRPLTVITF